MRNVFLLLCELGAVIPLAATEVGSLFILATMGASPHGAAGNSAGSLTVWAAAALTLGTAVVYYFFRRLWAQFFAGAVSLFWLFIGCQMLFDANVNPAKFEFGSRADLVMVLVIFGLIGSASFVGMFLVRWFLPPGNQG
jgi:hypothetical protein